MPKRGSSTSGINSSVPHKKSKNSESTNGHYDENTPLNQSSYSTQIYEKGPDVSLIFLIYNTNQLFVSH